MNVSVIVPVYNEEKYIAKCLTSLAEQTLKPDELIVVDDGSTDASLRIIERWKAAKKGAAKKVLNLKILRQKHQGPAKARNRGAKAAHGEILVFVDADMYFDKKYLARLIKPILEKKAVATFSKEEKVANSENIWSKCWSINSYLPEDLHIDPLIGEEANNFRAIRRDLFLESKGYADVGYGEDVTVLATLAGVKARAAPGAVCYHFNPESLAEVFASARWMGRGETVDKSWWTLLTYSFPNSLRKGVVEALRHAKPQFLVFKIVFDCGMLMGMVERRLGKSHAK